MEALASVVVGFLCAVVVWRIFFLTLTRDWLIVTTTSVFVLVSGLTYLMPNDPRILANVAQILLGIL
jgi:hypothetical protein